MSGIAAQGSAESATRPLLYQLVTIDMLFLLESERQLLSYYRRGGPSLLIGMGRAAPFTHKVERIALLSLARGLPQWMPLLAQSRNSR